MSESDPERLLDRLSACAERWTEEI